MMKNDITYEYRVFTDRPVDVESMEVGKCTSKVLKDLKSKDKVDGRFFHTSDTDEWFFCWNGKLQKLNLKGNADVNSALDEANKIANDAKNAAEEAKKTVDGISEIASQAQADAAEAKKTAEGIAETASQAKTIAEEAKTDAADAMKTVNNKADKDYVDEELKNKADMSALDGYAKIVHTHDYATIDHNHDDVYAKLGDVLTQDDLAAFATQDWVGEQGYALKSDLDGYAKTEDIKEPITYIAGSNIDITDNKISAKGYTYNAETNSIAEGEYTIANNRSEHAEGHFNLSNKNSDEYGDSLNTQHSIGVGTDSDNRKNAFEVMQNGDAYLIGVGEYDGTNPNKSKTLQEVINAGSVDTSEFVKESELADKLYGLATEDYVDQEISKIQNSSYDDTEIKNQLATKADKSELFSKSYNDLTDKPDLFSKSYNDLTDKPTIPSIDGLASIDYVDQSIITKVNVSDFNSHKDDTNIHVTLEDKIKWNSIEQSTKEYADSLVKDSEGKSLFDAAQSAAEATAAADATSKANAAETSAKEYADSAAAKALSDAKSDAADLYQVKGNYLTEQSLDNYYTKAEVYTQAEIDAKIQAINDLIGDATEYIKNTILA